MASEVDPVATGSDIERELDRALNTGTGSLLARFALNCISGAVPFAGGVFGAAAGAWSESEQDRLNKAFHAWMKLQEREVREIAITMMEILHRLDLKDEQIHQRIQSPEYQALVRKAFRDWAAAESEEKRCLVRKLLCHAAYTRICSDDVVTLFIEWIRKFNELHFRVIREIHKAPGATRADIWEQIHGEDVRENSAEADLFKLLISDLSIGHVIRQHRPTDTAGNFYKATRPNRSPRRGTKVMTSAFDDDKEYELTELGKQFVHYTMDEIIPKIGATPADNAA